MIVTSLSQFTAKELFAHVESIERCASLDHLLQVAEELKGRNFTATEDFVLGIAADRGVSTFGIQIQGVQWPD